MVCMGIHDSRRGRIRLAGRWEKRMPRHLFFFGGLDQARPDRTRPDHRKGARKQRDER